MSTPTRTDVLVVGAGPAGSAAAAWAARAGLDTLLVDAAVFPRDKTCGDGLTPRAIGELQRLGLEDWLRAHTVNQGLRAHGFGQTLLLPWPGGIAARLGLRRRPYRARRPPAHHRDQGRCATPLDGARAVDVRRDGRPGHRRLLRPRRRRRSRWRASGWSSPTASAHRWASGWAASGTATPSTPSPAGRYVDSAMSDDPWISSHLELRDEERRDPQRLRLGVPARQRLGEPRRRDARHREATRRGRDQAADAALRRHDPRRVQAQRASCGRRPRRCCRWAARSPTSPAATGR